MDLTGLVIGKIVVIESLGGLGHAEQWLCLCSCGTELTRCHRSLREAMQQDRPLACDACKRGFRERVRSTLGFCAACGSMPWRVTGPRCRRCGLHYADEPPVHAMVTSTPGYEPGIYLIIG